MIWVECPRSAGADFEVPQKLAGVLQLMLIEKGEFEPENVIVGPALDAGNSAVDLRAEARSLGAGYVLLVHVDSYSIDSLRVR
jgi:hypothetical protein